MEFGAFDVFEKEFGWLDSAIAAKDALDVPDYPPFECALRSVDDIVALLTTENDGELRVRGDCAKYALHSAAFARVRSDYYEQSLEWRRDTLGSANVECLCKSLLLENTACINNGCEDPRNSRYYVIVVQYVAQINSQKIFKFVREMSPDVSKQHFHFRMADEQRAFELSGFEHNAIAPFGFANGNLPIIMAKDIVDLNPDWFWLGGGSVDLKLGFKVSEFVQKLNPFIVDIYK